MSNLVLQAMIIFINDWPAYYFLKSMFCLQNQEYTVGKQNPLTFEKCLFCLYVCLYVFNQKIHVPGSWDLWYLFGEILSSAPSNIKKTANLLHGTEWSFGHKIKQEDNYSHYLITQGLHLSVVI